SRGARETENCDPEPGADGWIRWQASLCMSWGWSLLLIGGENEVTRIRSPSQQQDEANFRSQNEKSSAMVLGRMGVALRRRNYLKRNFCFVRGRMRVEAA
ncbi:unnamed protein product, partial [Tenebrio molitor]